MALATRPLHLRPHDSDEGADRPGCGSSRWWRGGAAVRVARRDPFPAVILALEPVLVYRYSRCDPGVNTLEYR